MARLFASEASEAKSFTATSNSTWTAPPGVTSANFIGRGVSGSPSSEEMYKYHQGYQVFFARVRSTGEWVEYSRYDQGIQAHPNGINSYCGASYSSSDEGYSAYRECWEYTYLYDGLVTVPPSQGEASSVPQLGLQFPGSYGDTVPNTSLYPNNPVVPGTTYQLNVPAGGFITIDYTV